jgi:hypothetical protein
MGKSTPIMVRSHAQEREWLLRLGDGNIVAGVRSLIQQAKEEPMANLALTQRKSKKRANHSIAPAGS